MNLFPKKKQVVKLRLERKQRYFKPGIARLPKEYLEVK